MMSLIDRGQVMNDYLENLGRKDSYKAKYEALVKAVDAAPTIDAEPVRHGGCKFCEDFDVLSQLVCYLPCENGGGIAVPVNYCPNCGAKIDLEVQHAETD